MLICTAAVQYSHLHRLISFLNMVIFSASDWLSLANCCVPFKVASRVVPIRSLCGAHDSVLSQILTSFDRMEARMDDNIGEVKSMAGKTVAGVARLSAQVVNSNQETEKDRWFLYITNHELN